MTVVTNLVQYVAPCPECGTDAVWLSKSVGERVPLNVHSTQDYYDDHIIITVRCSKCDAKDMKWTAA
jgi:endogenous inhibitor of DNA gyrase (YacG/DUF329 family)